MFYSPLSVMFVISLYHILCNFCNRMLFKFQLVSLMPLRNESELYLFQHDVELFIPLPRILRSAVSVSTENFWWQAHSQFALSVLRIQNLWVRPVYTFNGTSLYLHFKKSNKIQTKLFGKKYYCKSLVW